jgi:hypothetical protein
MDQHGGASKQKQSVQLGDAVSATHSRWPSPAFESRWYGVLNGAEHEVWWTYETGYGISLPYPYPSTAIRLFRSSNCHFVSFVTAFGCVTCFTKWIETNQTLLEKYEYLICSVRSKK